jgi:hypothetical protein
MRKNLARAKKAQPTPLQDEPPLVPALSLASWTEVERLLRARREAIVVVDQPLVLISQVQRSGGTLINTLLDGHPELHAHPHELQIGYPTKADWPVLNLDAGSDAWLETLSENPLSQLFAGGYRKKPDADVIDGFPTLPFTVVPTFLEHLFRLLCADMPPLTQRHVIDRYMTAFFNAWLDNQGLRDEPKRWVTAFAPRAGWAESGARFFADYPDGRVVSCLRDPRAWYASASRFSGRYGEFEEAMAVWERGAREIAAAKRERPEQVFVVTYETVVGNTERAMRALSRWLGIAWQPSLLVPTFNRLPTVPNSSYELLSPGIHEELLDRWREVLHRDLVAAIERQTLTLYHDTRELADVA